MAAEDLVSRSSPLAENTSNELLLVVGEPALSDAIALQQYEFEKLLANQQLWSHQLAMEQEAKIKAAAEQVKERASELTKVLKGDDQATPKLDALESFHERHVHDLRLHSETSPHPLKSESKLACPDGCKKEKKENEDHSPKCLVRNDKALRYRTCCDKLNDRDRSSPLSSGRSRKRNNHGNKDRGKRSRSKERGMSWGRDKIRSRSRGRVVRDRHQERRSRSKERGRDRHRERSRCRSRSKERGRGRDKSTSSGGVRDRLRERSRSRSRSKERGRVRDKSGSRGGARDREREKTRSMSTSMKGHSSADYLKADDVAYTARSGEKNGADKPKGKDGKQIHNDKSLGGTHSHDKFSDEKITRRHNSNNKSVSGKSAPLHRNYQTAASDGGSLAMAKNITDWNGDSPAPAPLDHLNPNDHQFIIEEGEIV